MPRTNKNAGNAKSKVYCFTRKRKDETKWVYCVNPKAKGNQIAKTYHVGESSGTKGMPQVIITSNYNLRSKSRKQGTPSKVVRS